MQTDISTLKGVLMTFNICIGTHTTAVKIDNTSDRDISIKLFCSYSCMLGLPTGR